MCAERWHNEAPDGAITRITDTPTGLRPSDAVSVLTTRWMDYGAQPIEAAGQGEGSGA